MKSAVALLSLLACPYVSIAQAQIKYPNPIKHVVLVIQENRTPDNLFQGLRTWPGVNSANYDLASSGLALVNGQQISVPLTPVALDSDYDPDHNHKSFVDMYDNGKMDGANLILDLCRQGATDCTNRGRGQFLSYRYVVPADVGPYLQMVAQWGWANYMFQTNQGASFAAHQFLFAGTSAFSAADDANGTFVTGNPFGGTNYQAPDNTGCLAPLGEQSYLISMASAPDQYSFQNDPLGTMCHNHDTMATLLDAAGVSWKYYVTGTSNPYPSDPNKLGYNPGGYMFNAPNSIAAICVPDYTQADPVCTGPEYFANVELKSSNILNDIAQCELAGVSWVTPKGPNSDHPGSPNGGHGPAWVASIVNAIGNDTTCEQGEGYWSNTAIIVTWDDWGGWYDHVAPTILPGPPGDYQYGFRVPFIVISPYTPAGYVNNRRLDFGSLLRFVQGVFNIPEGSLGFADARATNDLAGFFNFYKKRPFQPVQSPVGIRYFLQDTGPSDPPDRE